MCLHSACLLFLAAAFVKYRDVQYIWEVALQAGFYCYTIIYAMSRIKSLYGAEDTIS